MVGKTYSMQEMKRIVNHLVDTKAYSETKGRKMWMDFANSKLTNRTWQSLKETFLKRILPDIHNPYYNLTVEQINSFRAGYDVKVKNRLEVVQVSSGSSDCNGNDNKDTESDITNIEVENAMEKSNKNVENRSVHTVNEPCYENAEAILRDLESPEETNEARTSSKSLRDCISYSEPLTPLIQELLDDFASEPESEGGHVLQIVESNENTENVEVNSNGDSVLAPDTEAPLSNLSTHVHPAQSEQQTIHSNAESIDVQITPNKVNETEKGVTHQDSTNIFTAENGKQVETTTEGSQKVATLSKVNHTNTQLTTDASLPNNQEGLNKPENKELSQSLLQKPKRKLKIIKPKKTAKLQLVSADISKSSKAPSTNKNSNEEIIVPTSSNIKQKRTETGAVLDTEVVEKRQSAEINNPCLQSVSLFDNELNRITYDTSESSSNEEATNTRVTNDVVLLHSHSDSDTEQVLQLHDTFDDGSRRRKNLSRRRTFSKETTKRPHSARILSMEEEGGLFVMYNNKLYPLVKDTNTRKNYVTYLPDSNEICPRKEESLEPVPIVSKEPTEKIKITLTEKTKNMEVVVEGQTGSQISSVLEQVMSLFNQLPGTSVAQRRTSVALERNESCDSTPPAVDLEVHQKIDKIEEEIFKEIQQRDEEESKKSRTNTPVSIAGSPAKRRKLALKRIQDPSDRISISNPGSTRSSPRNTTIESTNSKESKTIETRKSKERNKTEDDSQDDVRYMFPPQTKGKLRVKVNTNTRNKRKSVTKPPRNYSSLENTIESTQGYEDSDHSPIIEKRKKRKSLSTAVYRGRRTSRRIYPLVCYDASNDSSNSSTGHVDKVTRDNATLDTQVYTSESYQLLMPPTNSKPPLQLEPIREININEHFDDNLISEDNSVSPRTDPSNNIISGPPTSQLGSPNTLPLSPEISLIENLSVSRDLLNRDNEYPDVNDTEANDLQQPIAGCSKCLIPNDDESMKQVCDLHHCIETTNSHDPKSLVTESLICQIGAFDLEDKVPTTDRLNENLRDLLLESAKKMMMAIDVNSSQDKKAAAKKRCSTPRRKQTLKPKKSLVANNSVVEEEHVDYSQARRSCPPAIETFEASEETNLAIIEKPKRKKKDIIKVKIVRPSKSKESIESALNTSMLSVSNDSGIHREVLTGVDNIDINEEDHMNDVGDDCDSVQFVEVDESVITLDDSIIDDHTNSPENHTTQNI